MNGEDIFSGLNSDDMGNVFATDNTIPTTPDEPIKGTRVSKTEQKAVNNVPQQTNVNFNVNQNLSNIDPRNLGEFKIFYTDAEWDLRSKAYADVCSGIKIDATNMTSDSILVAASKIDAVLTPLRIDFGYVEAQLARYDNLLKVVKSLKFNAIKTANSGAKLTVGDIESLVTQQISAEKVYEEGIDLFNVYVRYLARHEVIKSYISLLQDKKDLLITCSAMLKIENSVSNMTPSVPTNSQFNQMRG